MPHTMAIAFPPPGSLVVERGDPSAYDWTLTNFIRDGAWHDLNCASIVPPPAKWIIFKGLFRHTLGNQGGYFRKKGYTTGLTGPAIQTPGGGIYLYQTLIVACNNNRVIEYYFSSTPSWQDISMIVCQWII